MLLPNDFPVAQIQACMQRYHAIMQHTIATYLNTHAQDQG